MLKLSKNFYSQAYLPTLCMTCIVYIKIAVRFLDVKPRNSEHFHFFYRSPVDGSTAETCSYCVQQINSYI